MKLTKSGWFRAGKRWEKLEDREEYRQQALQGAELVLVEDGDGERHVYVSGAVVTIAELEDAIAFKRAERKEPT